MSYLRHILVMTLSSKDNFKDDQKFDNKLSVDTFQSFVKLVVTVVLYAILKSVMA